MKFKYAFNLGRVFTLSLAELFAVFESMKLDFRLVDLYREVLIIEVDKALDAEKLQKRLGGTIKIIEVLDSLGRKKQFGPGMVFKDYFDAKLLKERYLSAKSGSPRSGGAGKIQIGVSIYPMARQLPLRFENKRLGLMIKDLLTVAGFSVRIVFPQRDAISLPSVVVTNEHLLEKGAEIDFLVGAERIYVGKTLAVQDFEDYGRRDYQRPVRDQQVGMLPPKVAKEMINLSQAAPPQVVLDPFVGSGTVAQEAIIMGLRAVGSDISEKAVLGAEKNLEWIKNRYKLPQSRYELVVSDVKDLEEKLPKNEYATVVTEGTLGPAYQTAPKPREIEKNFKALEKIYLAGFKAIHKALPLGSRVVTALPCYRSGGKYIFFPAIDKIAKLGYDIITPLPEVVLEKYDFLEVTPRKSIIYDRKDQFVSREIFIFVIT